MAGNFSDLQYHVFKDFDIPFDEKGATCGTVRLVQWLKTGSEPDESKAKIEIRKVYTSGAEEKLGKGYTFSTPDGPTELVHGLIDCGYGKTKEILKRVRTRDDFIEAAENINSDDDDNYSGEMFDMRSLLLSEDGDDNEES